VKYYVSHQPVYWSDRFSFKPQQDCSNDSKDEVPQINFLDIFCLKIETIYKIRTS